MEWFLEITTLAEKSLGIIHFSPVVKFVTYLFTAMAVGIIVFFLFILLTLICHQIGHRLYKIYHKRYTLWIINYLIDPELPFPEPDLLFKKAFEGAILDLLLVTKGLEKNTLFRIYRRAGFWEDNLSRLRNPFWHARLGALVRMDLWQFSLGVEMIQHLLEDENIQIRQIALKNLSRTKDDKEARTVLLYLAKGDFFYSVQYETICRLIRIHRELILNSLNDGKFKKIHSIVLKVIGDSRLIEGVPSLLKAAKENDSHVERELALISLGKIGDPRGLNILKEGLRSAFPQERLASLRSLFLIDPEIIKNNSAFLKEDRDASVRSWYDHYQRGGQ